MNPGEFFNELLESLHYNRYLRESNSQKPQYARIMALKEMIQDIDKNDIEESFNHMIM